MTREDPPETCPECGTEVNSYGPSLVTHWHYNCPACGKRAIAFNERVKG